MRDNYSQTGTVGADNRIYIEHDWYSLGLPSNIVLAPGVFIDTSYGFSGFHSELSVALEIGEGSGCYDRSSMIVSKQGRIEVGRFTILNGTTLMLYRMILPVCFLA